MQQTLRRKDPPGQLNHSQLNGREVGGYDLRKLVFMGIAAGSIALVAGCRDDIYFIGRYATSPKVERVAQRGDYLERFGKIQGLTGEDLKRYVRATANENGIENPDLIIEGRRYTLRDMTGKSESLK